MSAREGRWALRNEDDGCDREPDGLLPKMEIFFARWRSRKRDERPGAHKNRPGSKNREIQPKNGPSREKWRRGAFSAGRDSPPLAHRHRPHPGAVGAGPVQNLGQNLGSEVDGLVREV